MINSLHSVAYSCPVTLSVRRHAPSSLGCQLGKEFCMHVMTHLQAQCAHASFEACSDSCNAVHKLCAAAESTTTPTTALWITMRLYFFDRIAAGRCAFLSLLPLLALACNDCKPNCCSDWMCAVQVNCLQTLAQLRIYSFCMQLPHHVQPEHETWVHFQRCCSDQMVHAVMDQVHYMMHAGS